MATKKKKTKTTKPSTKPKKKVTPKKKTPAKKKKLAKWVNPHIGYRYFLIEVGGRGGELKVNTVSKEFVDYWLDDERDGNVTDHIYAMHQKAMDGDFSDEDNEDNDYDGYDENSPELWEGSGDKEYWNLDGIEGGTFVSSEYNNYSVVEIVPHEETIYGEYGGSSLSWADRFTKKRNFDWSKNKYETVGETKEIVFDRVVYSRELYLETNDKDIVKAGSEAVPAIMIYDSQKGTFGHLLIRTNGEDFDSKKLAYVVCENNMGDHVTRWYYDKEELDFDYDSLSTWGKGFDVSVGYLHKWDVDHDSEACLKEGWEELEETN